MLSVTETVGPWYSEEQFPKWTCRVRNHNSCGEDVDENYDDATDNDDDVDSFPDTLQCKVFKHPLY